MKKTSEKKAPARSASGTVKVSISLPHELFQKATDFARKDQRTISGYFQKLVMDDTSGRPVTA